MSGLNDLILYFGFIISLLLNIFLLLKPWIKDTCGSLSEPDNSKFNNIFSIKEKILNKVFEFQGIKKCFYFIFTYIDRMSIIKSSSISYFVLIGTTEQDVIMGAFWLFSIIAMYKGLQILIQKHQAIYLIAKDLDFCCQASSKFFTVGKAIVFGYTMKQLKDVYIIERVLSTGKDPGTTKAALEALPLILRESNNLSGLENLFKP